ncbi:MAG: AAA family ATPase, partial [Candidatus Limnocylindrales bacterium]
MTDRIRSLIPIRVEEFLAATRDAPTDLIQGLLGPGEVAVLGAEPKLGKTWLALQFAIAAASGTPLAAHWLVPKCVRTLLVVEEGRPGDLKDRLTQLLSLSGGTAVLELFVLPFQGFRLDAPDDVAELIRQIKSLEVGLVILDPLYRMHRQDENDAVAMRPVIAALRTIADTEAGVLLVHHLRKPARDARSGGGASGADLRG